MFDVVLVCAFELEDGEQLSQSSRDILDVVQVAGIAAKVKMHNAMPGTICKATL